MSKLVMVAEDDPFISDLYRINIERAGFTVKTVANGEEAIEAIDQKQPDILLLDLLMPVVDGKGVLKHIQKKKYVFPVIVLSNLSEEIEETALDELGATGYFVKSEVDLDQMVAIIKKHVA